ncbi:hypothetical protein B0H63DRAFT_528752 [Podospora didyma]|uniref:Uncharacterized protein n=1 Tax=Podospora didyma TaxID=330526 RepID=A0AAE0N342_9PEZI|nr:hypothetical protein B0H63DRAFT_528752 [Podospora didyma]
MHFSIVLTALVSVLATSVAASPNPNTHAGGVVEGTCTTGGNGNCAVREYHNGKWNNKNVPCSPDKRARVRERRQQHNVDDAGGAGKAGDDADGEDADSFNWIPFLLYEAYGDGGQLWEKLPDSMEGLLRGTKIEAALTEHMATRTMEFSDANEMEGYMSIKPEEIVFLKHQHQKMPEMEQAYADRFLAVMKKQAQYDRGSKEWNDIQNEERKLAFQDLRIAEHVVRVLPAIVMRAEEMYKEIGKRLKKLHERRE